MCNRPKNRQSKVCGGFIDQQGLFIVLSRTIFRSVLAQTTFCPCMRISLPLIFSPHRTSYMSVLLLSVRPIGINRDFLSLALRVAPCVGPCTFAGTRLKKTSRLWKTLRGNLDLWYNNYITTTFESDLKQQYVCPLRSECEEVARLIMEMAHLW